jgi:hypothetical protein
VTSAKQVVDVSGLTLPTVLSTLATFRAKGIVAKLTRE